MGGDSKKGKPYGLIFPGGRDQETMAPMKAVNDPRYGPKIRPNIDAISASKLIFISGMAIAGT